MKEKKLGDTEQQQGQSDMQSHNLKYCELYCLSLTDFINESLH